MYSITETQQIIIYYMNQLQISRSEFGRSDVICMSMLGSRRAALTSVIKFSFTKWREKKKQDSFIVEEMKGVQRGVMFPL